MKRNRIFWTTLLLLSVSFPLSADEKATDRGGEERRGFQLTSDYNLKSEFDAKELRSLAKKSSRTSNEDRRVMLLILHAAINKDASFQDLLHKPELREAKNVDLALSGYDYALNESQAALDRILAQLATEDIGADVDTIVVLQVLDEWDRTIRAFRKHFIHTDGAGGWCKQGFMSARSYLYPKKYAEMREAIEAPIKWPSPLLPRKR